MSSPPAHEPLLLAFVDSGAARAHPHLAGASVSGFRIEPTPPFARDGDFADCTGHGTAAMAAAYRMEPRASFLAVRVLDEELRTTRGALAEAIRAAAEAGARVINLSLGSGEPEAEGLLRAAVDEAIDGGAICVASAHPRGRPLWPADLPTVLSALAHADCPVRDIYRVPGPLPRFVTHGHPRPIEGRAPTDNFFGPSFAAAYLSARVATLLLDGRADGLASVVEALRADSSGEVDPL